MVKQHSFKLHTVGSNPTALTGSIHSFSQGGGNHELGFSGIEFLVAGGTTCCPTRCSECSSARAATDAASAAVVQPARIPQRAMVEVRERSVVGVG